MVEQSFGNETSKTGETEQWYLDPNGVPVPRKSFSEN